MIPETLSHYRVVEKLGAGAMGEVYLAEDTKLDRTVALKILPPEFAENPERLERFVREAKAASAIKHANVAPIYKIGESDGVHFIAMQYVGACSVYCCWLVHILRGRDLCPVWRKVKSGDVKI